MRKYILTALLFIAFISTIYSQDNRPKEGPAFYFNNFQHYSNTNIDSAFYFIQKIATYPNSNNMLQDLLHNSFAQSFIKWPERDELDSLEKVHYYQSLANGKALLNKMASDTTEMLSRSVQSLLLWVKIEDKKNDLKKTRELVKEFISTQMGVDDIYQYCTGRYGLLIYQAIVRHPELTDLSQQLFTAIDNKLRMNQPIVNIDSASRPQLIKRAWYRYLYAYCNYLKAHNKLSVGMNNEGRRFFKLAFDYSPDLADQNNKSGYFYEMSFLFEKEKDSFQEEYVQYLIHHTPDKKQALKALLVMTLANPVYKHQLDSFYTANFGVNETFATYWINAINRESKKAPAISLQLTDGSLFTTSAYKGKWIFLDFWGTWCIPCRKEHPDLQKFYAGLTPEQSKKIYLLTVACRDIETTVNSYMIQYKYTFPVAMADKSIEKSYNIRGYPSKILITPKGNYLVIPFGTDWVEFIRNYCDL
jgi:thiol-disulfide isomerase/thioredoxin